MSLVFIELCMLNWCILYKQFHISWYCNFRQCKACQINIFFYLKCSSDMIFYEVIWSFSFSKSFTWLWWFWVTFLIGVYAKGHDLLNIGVELKNQFFICHGLYAWFLLKCWHIHVPCKHASNVCKMCVTYIQNDILHCLHELRLLIYLIRVKGVYLVVQWSLSFKDNCASKWKFPLIMSFHIWPISGTPAIKHHWCSGG